jgi:ketosteroid isomerase-like protein
MLMTRLLLAKFRRDVARLNAGDHRPLLSAYSDDAVLRFNEGDHRWAGEHRGKAAIETFLREFTGARVQGEIKDLWIAGPPWSIRMVARFDDHADGALGERLYENRTCLVIRTRFGKIVEHEDFYEDTARIPEFERALRSLGHPPRAWERRPAEPASDSDREGVLAELNRPQVPAEGDSPSYGD